MSRGGEQAASEEGGKPPRDQIRTAGRGLLSITAAKVYFILTSYAVQLTLPRLFEPAEFGLYTSAMRLASWINNILIVATVQSVSKLVSEDEDRAAATLRRGLHIQAVTAVVLGSALFSVAPVLAKHGLLDAKLGPLLRAAAVVVAAYPLYAVLVGYLNGRHLFQHQAALDGTFSTLRTAGLIGGAALGFGVLGSLMGFAGAAISILLVASVVVRWGRAGDSPPLKRWLYFMLPLIAYHACLNGILLVDQPLLKRTVAELMIDGGASAEVAADEASRFGGFYGAAQTFAFVPYQLLLSMTFVVFPMVSKAMAEGELERTRNTIRGAMRFSLLMLLAVAAPIGGAADGVMRLAYPEKYLPGAPALGVLVFGLVMLALFVVTATVLSAAGRPLLSAAIGLSALVVVIGANRLFVLSVGVGENTVRAAAAGTTLGMGVAMLIAGAILYRTFRAWLPPGPLVRGVVAGAVAYATAHYVPHDTPLTALMALAAGFFAYLVGLVIVREIRGADLEVVKRVLKR